MEQDQSLGLSLLLLWEEQPRGPRRGWKINGPQEETRCVFVRLFTLKLKRRAMLWLTPWFLPAGKRGFPES